LVVTLRGASLPMVVAQIHYKYNSSALANRHNRAPSKKP